jgi:hypothetical protein
MLFHISRKYLPQVAYFLKIYCYTKFHVATLLVGIDMDSCMVACRITVFISLTKIRPSVQPTGRKHIYMIIHKAYLYLQIVRKIDNKNRKAGLHTEI